MKKVLLLLSLCIMLWACDKYEPKNNKNHPPTPSQKVEEGIKDEELTAYFGLDKSLTVYQALEKAKIASGAKTIGGREISVTAVSEVSRNEQEGVFSLEIVGTMAGKAFEKVVAFAGFAQKPTDEAMAKRVVATWKSGVDYQKDFDFDTLYRLKDASKFTTGYLAQFIDFTASAPDGTRHYTFTAEDLDKTTISLTRTYIIRIRWRSIPMRPSCSICTACMKILTYSIPVC